MQHNQQSQINDEIDLKDLILALWEGKWIVLGCISIAMIIAVGYLKLLPQTYIGQFNLSVPEPSKIENDMLGANFTRDQLQAAIVQAAKHQHVADNISGNKGTITFTTTLPTTVKNQWIGIAEDVNTQLSAQVVSKTEMLDQQKQQYAKVHLIKQQQREAIIEEQIKIAKKIGLAKANQAIQATTPLYLRGYLALEAELAVINDRDNLALFVPESGQFEMKEIALQRFASIAQDHATTEKAMNLQTMSLQPKIKPTLILALSFVLGGMLGVIVLIIRNALRNY